MLFMNPCRSTSFWSLHKLYRTAILQSYFYLFYQIQMYTVLLLNLDSKSLFFSCCFFLISVNVLETKELFINIYITFSLEKHYCIKSSPDFWLYCTVHQLIEIHVVNPTHAVTFFFRHRNFHLNLTSFKRSPVLKDHFFFFPKVTS